MHLLLKVLAHPVPYSKYGSVQGTSKCISLTELIHALIHVNLLRARSAFILIVRLSDLGQVLRGLNLRARAPHKFVLLTSPP